MARPTIKDILNVTCPPEQPYKCLPYGKCYGYDKYCDTNSGTSESCFPQDVSDIASWCKMIHGNISMLPDPSCKFACEAKYPRPVVADTLCEYCSSFPLLWACIITAVVGVLVGVLVGVVGARYIVRIYRRSKAPLKENQELESPRTDCNVASTRMFNNVGREQEERMPDDNHSQSSDIASSLDAQEPIGHPPPDDSSGTELADLESSSLLTENAFNLNMRSDVTDRRQTSPSREHFFGNQLLTPSGPSSSASASTDNSSSGRYTSLDQTGRAQQLADNHNLTDGAQGRGCHEVDGQTQGHCRPGISSFANASIPDEGGHGLVTNLSVYEQE